MFNLHRSINGNWPTYWKLKRKIKNVKLNKRFDLYQKILINDPYTMSMLPFDQEWQMDCPGTENFESILFYGSNSYDKELILIRIDWKPINDGELIMVKMNLLFRNSDGKLFKVKHLDTVSKGDCVDQSGHLSNIRIGGLLIRVVLPFKLIRLTYRGFLCDIEKDCLVFARFNLQWMCLTKVFDFQKDFSKDFMLKEFASKDHCKIEMQNRFEQWGQIKGTVQFDDNPLRVIYLWGIKSKTYEEPCSGNIRLYGYNCKGFGFSIGVINTADIKYRYGLVNHGVSLLSGITGTDIEVDDISNFEMSKHNPFTIKCEEECRNYDVNIGTIVASIDSNTKMYSLQINNHDGIGLLIIESELLNFSEIAKQNQNEELKINDDDYVVRISDPKSTMEFLTGGKGSSLGVLFKFSKQSTILFNVPDGIVVTSKAYEFLLKSNQQLEKDIHSLESFIRSSNELSSIETQCERVQNAFENTLLPGELRKLIELNLVEIFGMKDSVEMFAVRSSACGEDSNDMSAAGLMKTFLGVQGLDNICQSVVNCWASQFSLTAVEYKRGYGLSINSPMAVVVQRMIHCDSAGVAFTCDPVNGNERYVTITANYGVGESVVSALVEPDSIKLEVNVNSNSIKDPRTIKDIVSVELGSKAKLIQYSQVDNQMVEINVDGDKRDKCCLEEEQIRILGNVVLEIQRHYGNCRDIEWGFKDGQLFILQSRPITHLDVLTEYEVLHEMDSGHNSEKEMFSRANLGEVFSGATSHLCITWMLSFWNAIVFKTWKELFNLKQHHFNPYYNIAYACVCNTLFFGLKTGTFPIVGDENSLMSKAAQMSMFGHEFTDQELIADSKEKAPRKLLPLSAKLKASWKTMRMLTNVKKKLKITKNFKVEFAFDPETVNSKQLFDILCHQTDKYMPAYDSQTNATMASMIYNGLLFVFIFNKFKNYDESKRLNIFSNIISSAQNVISAEVPVLLNKIAESIPDTVDVAQMSNEQLLDYLQTSNDDAAVMFRQFLVDYGHRGPKEFDCYSRQWEDDPTAIIESLKTLASNKSQQIDNSSADKDDNFLNELNCFNRMMLKRILVPLTKNGIRNREMGKNLIIKSLHQYRKLIWKLGDVLVQEGKLPDRELIFFMLFHELENIINAPNSNIIALAKLRKRYHERKSLLKFHELVYGPEMKSRNDEEFVDYSSFSKLKGVPVCSGKVTGRCCVAFSLKDAKQIKKGDILVTFSTDIGWSPYFSIISGLITEIGGLISHGAVIAREYGLPCLVNATNATNILRTGDLIMIDTEAGEVIKLESDNTEDNVEDNQS